MIEYRLSEFKILLGDHSNLDPPDSMPNSVVKRISADGSVGLPHVRVGHCQVPLRRTRLTAGFLLSADRKIKGSESEGSPRI